MTETAERQIGAAVHQPMCELDSHLCVRDWLNEKEKGAEARCESSSRKGVRQTSIIRFGVLLDEMRETVSGAQNKKK